MTRIDNVRLAEIFRTLRSKSSEARPETSGTSSRAVNKDNLVLKRDENVLKTQLRRRLKMLKTTSDDFYQEAPLVTIQEIMIWEFGDQFLKHPEFKPITHSIVATIEVSPQLSTHMRSLVEDLSR